eukprot:Em0009g800a
MSVGARCTGGRGEKTEEMTPVLRVGVGFVPLAVETYGNSGKEAHNTFSRLASSIAITSSCHKSHVLAEVYSRFNLTLVRAIARSILGWRTALGSVLIFHSPRPADILIQDWYGAERDIPVLKQCSVVFCNFCLLTWISIICCNAVACVRLAHTTRVYVPSNLKFRPNWFSGLDELVLGQLFNPRAGSGQHRKAAGSGSTLDSDWFTGVSVSFWRINLLQPSLDTIITTMGSNSSLLNRVLTEQENIKATLNDLVQSSFCIEKSGFKDDLLVESGLLFCKVMDRLPDQKEISVLVVKVLKLESQKKYKKSTAVRFVKERLSELRAEERRRILGLRPCKDFAVLRCDEFVDKFLPFLKVEKEAIPNYKLHVAVLCKYCRSVLTSQTNTYKGFQTWLKMHFHEGIPSSVEMQTMLAEEDSILYPQLQPARSPPPMLSPQQPIEPVYEDYS